MSIFDKIWNAVKTLLPFLAKAAEKTFNELEDAAKDAGINGSLFAQIIKENTDAAGIDVRNLLRDKLKMTDAQLDDLMFELSARYNVRPTEVIGHLQHEFATRIDDILHNSFANEIASLVGIILSNGKLTWLTLLMGVGEYIYRKYVKGADVRVMDVPDCGTDKVWDPVQQRCVPNVG